jgi:hypothetical protein
VVHLARLVTAGQKIPQSGWQQLKECLAYLAAEQQQQQQQLLQQELQGKSQRM